jgi:hypothetical protein
MKEKDTGCYRMKINTSLLPQRISGYRNFLRDIISHIILTATYGIAGREEEACAAEAEILKINSQFSLERFEMVNR